MRFNYKDLAQSVGRVKCKICELPMLDIAEDDPRKWHYQTLFDKTFCDCPEGLDVNPDDNSKYFYRRQFQIHQECVEKLKRLILLTDPAVSDVEMNTLSLNQWAEYVRWHKEKWGMEP